MKNDQVTKSSVEINVDLGVLIVLAPGVKWRGLLCLAALEWTVK